MGTLSLAFPVGGGDIYDDIDVRIGGTVHSRNNLAVSFYWNMNLDNSTNSSPDSLSGLIPSLAFGFTF